MNIETIALHVGYCVLVFGGVTTCALAFIGTTLLINRATWKVVDCYGGIKTLREFGVWYRNKEKANEQAT